jgi:hypothetical protein
MSAPTATESEPRIPITSPGLHITRSSAIILLQYGVVAYLVILISYWYWSTLIQSAIAGLLWEQWFWWALFPLSIFGNVFLFPFLTLLFTKLIVDWSKRRYPPREGVFHLDSKEYKAWQFRQHAMLYAIWLARHVPLPWIDMAFFKLTGVQVRGNPVLYDTWVDTELIKFGRDNMLSLNCVIISHMVIPGNPRKFLVKGIETSDFCIIGAESVTAPGTTLENGAIFGGCSATAVGQHLEGNWIYGGNPAKKLIPSSGPVPNGKSGKEIPTVREKQGKTDELSKEVK